MIINVPQRFKDNLRAEGRQINSYLYTEDGIIINSDELRNLKPNYHGNLFKSIMRKLEIEYLGNLDLKDKYLKCFFGVKSVMDEDYDYICLGEYKVIDIKSSVDRDSKTLICYDRLVETMTPYDLENISFPITNLQLLQLICKKIGIELGTTDFPNSDLVINEDFFTTTNTSFRDILDLMSESAGRTIFIHDNKLVVSPFIETGEKLKEGQALKSLTFKEEVKAINSLVLSTLEASDGSTSDDVYIRDEESVEQIGIQEIKFVSNTLLNQNRGKYIVPVFNEIKGMNFYPFEAETYAFIYFEPCDLVYIEDLNGIEHKCPIFNSECEINTGVLEKLYTDVTNRKETDYEYADAYDKRITNAQIIVNKHTGQIQLLTSDISSQGEKISQLTIDVDEIKSIVGAGYEFLRTVSGKLQLHFDESLEYVPHLFSIRGYTESRNLIYPSRRMFPSKRLFPKRFVDTTSNKYTIVVDRNPRDNPSEEKREYEIILEEPLRSLGSICDEIIISYTEIKLIRRLELKNNKLFVLETPIETTLESKVITFLEGSNYVYIKETIQFDMNLEYLTNIEMNKYFCTKLELKSEIKQTAEEISLEVARKVDEDEFGTKITQNAESIQIAWNQISQYFKFLTDNYGNANLNIYDENNDILMSLNREGQDFYCDGNKVGKNGAMLLESEDLETGHITRSGAMATILDEGAWLSWLAKKGDGDEAVYSPVLTYTRDNLGRFIFGADEIHLGYAESDTIAYNLHAFRVYANNVANTRSFQSFDLAVVDNRFGVEFTTNSGDKQYVYIDVSDGRLKSNIKETEEKAIEKIKKIKHFEFDWSENKHENIGYIAQEMKKIDENFVNGSEDNYYQINTLSVLATCTKAIQEQNEVIEELRNQNSFLMEKLNLKEDYKKTIKTKRKTKNRKIYDYGKKEIKPNVEPKRNKKKNIKVRRVIDGKSNLQ